MAPTPTTIPLSKLVPSPANVRKTGPHDDIEELAASIDAHGLLQNLTVRPVAKENGSRNGSFEVIAGGRRLAALKLLAKRKKIAKHHAVPCRILKEGDPVEVSLAENIVRAPVHPADQFEAFSALHAQGLGAEDIAARFGIAATAVAQRLKLAAVSPRLMAVYRGGEMSLDQLVAFAVSDDHAAQEAFWFENPYTGKDPGSIRRALTASLVPSSDRRARFVGTDAYEAAGGSVVRDLFDERGGGYLADRDLLDRLVAEKLAEAARPLEAEGWAWVEIAAEADYERLAAMGRVSPSIGDLPDDLQEKLEGLAKEYDALVDEHGEDPDEDVASRLDRLSDEIEALNAGRCVWPEETKAKAGVLAVLDPEGAIRVERGLVRPEDRTPAERPRQPASNREGAEKSSLPDTLVEDLTAHRTAALRAVVGENPPLALVTLVYTLALPLLYGSTRHTCLSIRCDSPSLGSHAPGIGEGSAVATAANRQRVWQEVLPEEERFWPWLITQDASTQMKLLAHCVAATIDAVVAKNRGNRHDRATHADTLALASRLNMADWWEPTTDRYFGRVSKALILSAVSEAISPNAAENIARLKKEPMAMRAAELIAGKRWLPELLRTPATPAPETAPADDTTIA